jgi:hypothetical protein
MLVHTCLYTKPSSATSRVHERSSCARS